MAKVNTADVGFEKQIWDAAEYKQSYSGLYS